MVKQSRFMLVFFALVLLVGFASATDSVIFSSLNVPETAYTLDQPSLSGSITIQCIGIEENKTVSTSIVSNLSSLGISTPSAILNCSKNESKVVSFTISNLLNKDSQMVFFQLEGNSSLNDTLNLVKIFSGDPLGICGNDYTSSNISVGDVDDGEDWDEDWNPLDQIKVSVEDIKNKADDDYKFDIELLFFNGKNDVSSDVATDSDDLEIDRFRIDEDDKEDVTFNFQVDGKVDDGSYDVYLKVSNSDAGCYVRKVGSVKIAKEEYYSIVRDVTGPTTADCGERVELTVDVANVGEEDDDGVKVILYNKELGLNLYKEIGSLDEGDTTTTSFSFAIPQGASAKLYKLILSTEFEYDEDDEEYREESDSDDDYTYSLNIAGSCSDPTKPTVTAKLNSTAEVGESLVVEISLTNNAAQTITPTVYAENYESWAELVGVSPASLSIAKQQTGKTYLTITPTKDGQQTFNIKVLYDGKIIEQPVTVAIEKDFSWFSVLAENVGTVAAYLIVAIALLVALILLILLIRALWHSMIGRIISYIIIVIAVILLVVFFFYLI